MYVHKLWLIVCILVLLSGCTPDTVVPSPTPTQEPSASNHTSPTVLPTPVQQETSDAPGLTVLTAPIVPIVSARMKEVHAEGMANGRNSEIFTRVGDCMSASPDFLFPYASGAYSLGEYDQLQAVVDHFRTATVREVDGLPVNSFSNPSLAVSCGFNSAGPIDPLWADPKFCEQGESSLTCELRVSNAAFVLIMLGTHDMHFEKERFKGYLNQIVEEAVDSGVIPILTTFPPRSDDLEKAEEYNGIVVEVAEEQQVPLANLWLALHDKPNYGVQFDHPTALSKPEDGCAVCFTEKNLQSGSTIQNWVALMALDVVWTAVSE